MKTEYFISGILLFFAMGCQPPPDPDLRQASEALSKMAVNRALKRSCFSVVYPDGGQASDFVNYLFSDLGVAEWPIAFDALEEEQLESIGQPSLPRNVHISPFTRQQLDSKEIVLIADNQNRSVLVEGYGAESTEATFKAEWSIGTTQADEATQQFCQSNLEMGISPYYQE